MLSERRGTTRRRRQTRAAKFWFPSQNFEGRTHTLTPQNVMSRLLTILCFAAVASGIRLGISGRVRGRSDPLRAAVQTRETSLRPGAARTGVVRAVAASQRAASRRARPHDDVDLSSLKGVVVPLPKSLSLHKNAALAPLATTRPGPLELLKQYGSAYIVTSLTMSVVSMTLFYLLASRGLDVRAMLRLCGIRLGDRAGAFSTLGVAYFAHKAASPLRFVPTVALTPRVARYFSKEEKIGVALSEQAQHHGASRASSSRSS